MYLERETSGATFAENCCANNAMTKSHKQKTPDRAGAYVFGAGNQRCDSSLRTRANNAMTKSHKQKTPDRAGAYVFGAGNQRCDAR